MSFEPIMIFMVQTPLTCLISVIRLECMVALGVGWLD